MIIFLKIKFGFCPASYFFIRYIASIKAGTQIIKVAVSGVTPNKFAMKSLIACI